MLSRVLLLLGCCALLAVGLEVAAAAQGQGNGQQKVTICHNGLTTITNGNPAAVNAHLKHGDTLGACAPTPPVTVPPGPTGTPPATGNLPGNLGGLALSGFNTLAVGCKDEGKLGGLAPPVLSELINVKLVGGEPLKIATPDGRFFCLSGGAIQVPVGSEVDARDSKVEVVTEGSVRRASFFDGLFQVLQGNKPHAVTVLKLIGPLEHCDTVTSKKPGGRQLWGEGEGLHRTDGRLAAATVRGTKWFLQDRCNGTTFAKVVHGVVSLRDRAKNKTVELKAGESYTAGP